MTKTVLETALNEEMTEHLGYEKHDAAGVGAGNIRNGARSKTVLTDASGAVQIDVPRDRVGTFEPQMGAKFWLSVLTDLRNRGVKDVFCLVCDGLKGLPDVVRNVWARTIVQTCIIHLIRNTFRLTSRRYWDELKHDIKPIYTAVNATTARAAFDDLAEKWGGRYPAVIRLWDNGWAEFIPFLDYDVEIRTVICSTNAIESLNARYRRAVKARGHFPNELAALKGLYLLTRSLDPTGAGRTRWTMRWKPALNAFAITFSDRFPAAETYQPRSPETPLARQPHLHGRSHRRIAVFSVAMRRLSSPITTAS